MGARTDSEQLATSETEAVLATPFFGMDQSLTHSLPIMIVIVISALSLSTHRSPVQVLVISLVFIALVVLLHIWGKMRGSSKEDEPAI